MVTNWTRELCPLVMASGNVGWLAPPPPLPLDPTRPPPPDAAADTRVCNTDNQTSQHQHTSQHTHTKTPHHATPQAHLRETPVAQHCTCGEDKTNEYLSCYSCLIWSTLHAGTTGQGWAGGRERSEEGGRKGEADDEDGGWRMGGA